MEIVHMFFFKTLTHKQRQGCFSKIVEIVILIQKWCTQSFLNEVI